jgi:hypothetical protein
MDQFQKDLLEHMRSTPVMGNAFSDRELWKICHEVAIDTSMPMKHRLEALAKMNELTGESEPCNVAALKKYLKDCI